MNKKPANALSTVSIERFGNVATKKMTIIKRATAKSTTEYIRLSVAFACEYCDTASENTEYQTPNRLDISVMMRLATSVSMEYLSI